MIVGLGATRLPDEANAFGRKKRKSSKPLHRVIEQALKELFDAICAGGIDFNIAIPSNGGDVSVELQTELDVLNHVATVVFLLVLDSEAEVPEPIISKDQWCIEANGFGCLEPIEILIERNKNNFIPRVL